MKPILKTEFGAIKKEIVRLANVNQLKTEINRIAGEVKKFDVHITLNDRSKARLDRLEKRFKTLLTSVADWQHQVEGGFEKFMGVIKKNNLSAAAANAKTAMQEKAKAKYYGNGGGDVGGRSKSKTTKKAAGTETKARVRSARSASTGATASTTKKIAKKRTTSKSK